jgi:hypothetical protein
METIAEAQEIPPAPPADAKTQEPLPSHVESSGAAPEKSQNVLASLTETETRFLCELAWNPKRVAYWNYAVQRWAAQQEGRPAPPEPSTWLKGPERQKLQTLAGDPRLTSGYYYLESLVNQAIQSTAAELPPPFPPLPPEAVNLLRKTAADPKKRPYLQYGMDRVLSSLSSRPPPSMPATSLSKAERQSLNLLFDDYRAYLLIVRLLTESTPTTRS